MARQTDDREQQLIAEARGAERAYCATIAERTAEIIRGRFNGADNAATLALEMYAKALRNSLLAIDVHGVTIKLDGVNGCHFASESNQSHHGEG